MKQNHENLTTMTQCKNTEDTTNYCVLRAFFAPLWLVQADHHESHQPDKEKIFPTGYWLKSSG